MPETQVVASSPAAPPKAKSQEPEHRDSLREAFETVAFVVVLVLLLKAFVAEAFVIPTGSMASTLFGYHREVRCEACGWEFAVNAKEEAMAQGVGRVLPVTHGTCPNCRKLHQFDPRNAISGGDKVLVFKPRYDLWQPERLDVIVFKYPGEDRGGGSRTGGPQEYFSAVNYIKRLWGLPGERLAIWQGDVYLRAKKDDGTERLDIIRKPPGKILEMRRIVYDNDHPAKDLTFLAPRWADEGAGTGWAGGEDGRAFTVQAGAEPRWLNYRHILRPPSDVEPGEKASLEGKLHDPTVNPVEKEQVRERTEFLKHLNDPQLITDFLAYNSGDEGAPSCHWVKDLLVDFEVEVSRPAGELTVRIAAGVDTHTAAFNLETGECVLTVRRRDAVVAERAGVKAGLNKAGKHTVRFCNFDDRLLVWADGKPLTDQALEFAGVPAEQRGPRLRDLHPVAIGAKNAAVTVRKLQLWRDIYYSREAGGFHGGSPIDAVITDASNPVRLARFLGGWGLSRDEAEQAAKDPEYYQPGGWKEYTRAGPKHYDVGPNEYFALGDNSTRSSDSRAWGRVPDQLLLGRAVAVYWPLTRFGLIW
jgi:signal peptidase I